MRLIIGLRAGQRRVHVETLRPGVISAKFQPMCKTTAHVHLQRVVTTVALGVPEETRAQVRVRPAAGGDILRALGYACRATRGAGADLGGNGVGVHAEKTVVSERPDIREPQDRVAVELPLHGETPLLDRWRLRVPLDTLGRVSSTRRRDAWAARGRGSHVRQNGQDRRQRDVGERECPVVGREGIQEKAEIVDQRVIGAEAGTQHGPAIAEDIPRQCDAGTE